MGYSRGLIFFIKHRDDAWELGNSLQKNCMWHFVTSPKSVLICGFPPFRCQNRTNLLRMQFYPHFTTLSRNFLSRYISSFLRSGNSQILFIPIYAQSGPYPAWDLTSWSLSCNYVDVLENELPLPEFRSIRFLEGVAIQMAEIVTGQWEAMSETWICFIGYFGVPWSLILNVEWIFMQWVNDWFNYS